MGTGGLTDSPRVACMRQTFLMPSDSPPHLLPSAVSSTESPRLWVSCQSPVWGDFFSKSDPIVSPAHVPFILLRFPQWAEIPICPQSHNPLGYPLFGSSPVATSTQRESNEVTVLTILFTPVSWAPHTDVSSPHQPPESLKFKMTQGSRGKRVAANN